MLYPGDERETVIKPTDQSKQSERGSETQKKHPDKTDGRRSKERPSESEQAGVRRSSGNPPRVSVESCSVREQLGGLRFDRALPGDQRLA